MLKKLEKFTQKSFKDYSMPDNIEFNSKNIVFGYNGRGKSSLAKEIVHQFNNEEKVRFFHRDYVEERLLVKDSESDINGVKAVFGKAAVETQKEIDSLKESIIDLAQDKASIKTKRQEIRDDIDKIFKSKKGSSSTQIKNNKPLPAGDIYVEGCLNIEWVLEQYGKDLKKAKKIISDTEELRKISGDRDYESEITELTNLNLPAIAIPCLTDEKIDKLNEICSKTYIDNIPRSEVVRWLSEGLELHKEDNAEKCIFCENNTAFNIEEIEKRTKTYQDSEKQNDSKNLESIHKEIENLVKKLSCKEELTKPLLGFFDKTTIDGIFDYESELKTLEDIAGVLSDKLKAMDKVMALGDIEKIKKDIVSLTNKDAKLKPLKTSKINELTTQQGKQNILINGAVGLAIEEDKSLNDKIEKLGIFESEVLKKYEDNLFAEGEIKRLEDESSDYGDFMKFLNKVLKNMSINLKLEFSEVGEGKKNYYLTQAINQGDDTKLSVKDISEGEKNLLALLFFYYEMYSDDSQKSPKQDIELVVVDDPISSLDDTNKTYVLEITKKILEDGFKQVFVFTHSWNDFCDMAYGKGEKKEYGFFEIIKNSESNSEIIKRDKKMLSPYNKLFKEIYKLSEKSSGEEIDDCELYHTSNSMRRVFEEFLSFKIGERKIPTRKNANTIEDLYNKYKTDSNKIGNFDNRLGAFLDLINIHSHRPLRSDEVVTGAKFLMRYIEITDKFHYDKMKQ